MGDTVHVKVDGDKLHIIHSEVPIFQYKGFQYSLDSTDSLISLIKRKGSNTKTVIFYNEDRIMAILDDTVTDRPQDTATYAFKRSQEYEEWRSVLDRPMLQKDFVDFLKRRPEGQVKDLDILIATVQQLKLATEIIGEYQTDDPNNITFMFKSKDGEGSASIPKTIIVNMPLLLEGIAQEIEIELEFYKPKAENERPVFKLSCPKMERYMKTAIEAEVEKLKEAFDRSWLILAG